MVNRNTEKVGMSSSSKSIVPIGSSACMKAVTTLLVDG